MMIVAASVGDREAQMQVMLQQPGLQAIELRPHCRGKVRALGASHALQLDRDLHHLHLYIVQCCRSF